jgi:hypothetical protein
MSPEISVNFPWITQKMEIVYIYKLERILFLKLELQSMNFVHVREMVFIISAIIELYRHLLSAYLSLIS